MDCFNCELKSLDLSNNHLLKSFACFYNKIESVNVTGCKLLRNVQCDNNLIKSLDFSSCDSLEFLDCSDNTITNLNISSSTCLRELLCYENLIDYLDLSAYTSLIDLHCSDNNLTILNLKNGRNKKIEHCDADNNPNLYCIQVDDSLFSIYEFGWEKDDQAHYSEDCGYTGMDDNKFENQTVSVAPNPAMDFIEINNVIHAEAGISDQNVKIFNFLGEIVSGLDTPPDPLFLEGGKCRIDVSDLPQGTYFVRFGGEIRKFIKL